MATDADISSDPISLSKREVEDKEMTSELSNITVTEASHEEKKSRLSQPPEIIEILEKTEIEDVANDDEVANMNVINKGNVETIEVFSQSLLVANENPEKYTEDSQMTSGDEKSKTFTNSVVIDMDPETIRPNLAMGDMKNKHGSSLHYIPVEETSFEKAERDVGECIEENMSIPYKEASKETIELTEKMKDSTSVQDEDLNKNLESSFAQNVEDVLFRKVDNLETFPKESESGTKDIVKESQYEAQNEKEIFENIASADRDQSKIGRHGEIHDTKADASFRKPRESTERENEDLITTEVLLKGRHEEDMGVTDEDEIVAEEQEKHETSTHEEQLEQRHMQKTVGKNPMDSKEIETEGSNKHAETITNIEDQRTDGIPGEIIGEKRKDETIIVDDFDKEIQEAKNFPTIDLDEKTTSAEFEIPNKSGGGELFVTHSTIDEEIQVGGENEDEVSMSQSDDRRKIIQNPNKEKKCANETFEATNGPDSTISEHASIEGALNAGVTSTSAEENVEEEREQIEKASNAKFSVKRKSDDNEESTVHADILVKNKTPVSSGEEYHHDQEEKVRSNNFQEEFTETDSGDQIDIISEKIDNINDINNREVCEDLSMADRSEYIEKDMKNEESAVTDCSPQPAGECTTNCSQGNQMEAKKKMAEKRDVDDKELTSELPKKNAESWLSQPPETIEILETECIQVPHHLEVGKVSSVHKVNVETIEAESFLKSTPFSDGILTKNTEDGKFNTKEEMCGFQEEEKIKMITNKKIILESRWNQDGVKIQSPELTEGPTRDTEIQNEIMNKEENMENVTSTETTSIEQDLKETGFEGEGKKSNTSSSSMGLEMDPEATQPSTDKDVCISNETASQDNHETNEQTESNVDSENNLGNSLVSTQIEETSSEKVGPPVCKNLEENSSMACEDESQETGKLSNRMKDDASIENEVQNQNLESSFVKEVEHLETSKEQSETGMDVDNETQKEAGNQSETLENITTGNLTAEDEDVEIPERKAQVSVMKPEERTTGDTEDVTSAEALTVECEPEVMGVPGADYVVVNEQETTEKSKQEEHTEQSFKQNTEPANGNMGSPSTVASEEFKTSLKDYAERISNINEERSIRIPEQILGKTIIAVDINKNKITEAKNLSTVDAGEKTRSAEVKIPNNISNEVYITHSPVEKPFPNKDETQNDVSVLESQEQARNETSEHEEHSKQSLMQDTETAKANLGRPSIVAWEFETTSHNEYVDSITNNQETRTDGSPEEILEEPRNDQTMIVDDI